ncbi:DMT family transporter [Streptomyces sp. CAU 1734]|uniref:DMT family transporter n=1 Tax=Streptomyces sp. CAU 1734 TaxID=3140360 RepID=UPI0032616E2A
MSSLVLAILLSLVSAVAYAAGAIVQERVAASSPARPYAPLNHTGWWFAVGLNGVGAVLHVVALAHGPLSVVQPLGALTIVFALPMAALFVGRRAGAAAWRGALQATAGLAGLLALAGDTGSRSLGTGQRGVLAAATLGTVALIFLVAQTIHRPVLRSVLLAAAAGTAFGIGSVFTKEAAVGWDWSSPLAQWPTLIVIAVLALGGLLLSQASYRGAGLAAPLATVTVINPVVAAAVGITMFGESFRYGVAGSVLALCFGAAAAGGLFLLTSERLASSGTEASAGADGAAGAPAAGTGVPEAAAPADGAGDREGRPGAAGTPGAGVVRTAAVRPLERLVRVHHMSERPLTAIPRPSGPRSARPRIPEKPWQESVFPPAGGNTAREARAREIRAKENPPAELRSPRGGRQDPRAWVRRPGAVLPAAAPPESASPPAAPVSERDAARPEIGQGVDVRPVSRPRPDLEVEMRPRAVAGGS